MQKIEERIGKIPEIRFLFDFLKIGAESNR